MSNILDTIVQQKRLELTRLPTGPVTAHDLFEAVRRRGTGIRDFTAALAQPRRGDVGLIAEVKKASPSLGVICPDFDPVRIALAYEAAGASCLSVLTDEKFFQGSLVHLSAIRGAVSLPLLRKDFIIDERQILEAVEGGNGVRGDRLSIDGSQACGKDAPAGLAREFMARQCLRHRRAAGVPGADKQNGLHDHKELASSETRPGRSNRKALRTAGFFGATLAGMVGGRCGREDFPWVVRPA